MMSCSFLIGQGGNGARAAGPGAEYDPAVPQLFVPAVVYGRTGPSGSPHPYDVTGPGVVRGPDAPRPAIYVTLTFGKLCRTGLIYGILVL